MPDLGEQPRCKIVVRRGSGRFGIRQEAQHVDTKEWIEMLPLTEITDEMNGNIDCYFGRLERLAPEGMNVRLIFEEMP